MRRGYGHKSHDTQFQTRSLFFHLKQAPLHDRLSQHLPFSSLLLCDDSKMPRARPISNRPPCVDQSLPLLLRLDLGPRHRVFDSPLPLQPPRFGQNSPYNFGGVFDSQKWGCASPMLCPLTRAHCMQFPCEMMWHTRNHYYYSACKLQCFIT